MALARSPVRVSSDDEGETSTGSSSGSESGSDSDSIDTAAQFKTKPAEVPEPLRALLVSSFCKLAENERPALAKAVHAFVQTLPGMYPWHDAFMSRRYCWCNEMLTDDGLPSPAQVSALLEAGYEHAIADYVVTATRRNGDKHDMVVKMVVDRIVGDVDTINFFLNHELSHEDDYNENRTLQDELQEAFEEAIEHMDLRCDATFRTQFLFFVKRTVLHGDEAASESEDSEASYTVTPTTAASSPVQRQLHSSKRRKSL